MANKSNGLYFASGNIFLREIFDVLLVQAYYKPGIVKVVEELCGANVKCLPIDPALWNYLAKEDPTAHNLFIYLLRKVPFQLKNSGV